MVSKSDEKGKDRKKSFEALRHFTVRLPGNLIRIQQPRAAHDNLHIISNGGHLKSLCKFIIEIFTCLISSLQNAYHFRLKQRTSCSPAIVCTPFVPCIRRIPARKSPKRR